MIEVAVAFTMLTTLAPQVDVDIRERYAADIAAVADTVEEAAALSVTQIAESDLDPRVESCQRTGDNGRSITGFQMQRKWWRKHTRAELCGSNSLAAATAVVALRTLRRLSGSWHGAFRMYVGVSTETDPNLRGRGHNFDRVMANWRLAMAKEQQS